MAKRSAATAGGRSKLAPGSRLPAEVVRASQRERLMIALVEVVDREGLPATTVSSLIERAHVSRAAFYEQFESLEDCFLATYDTQTARVAVQMVAAYETPGLSWPEQIEAASDTLALAAGAWPAAARVCLRDILTAGAAASERHEQTIALVRRTLDQSRAASDRTPVSRETAVAVTGALRRIAYTGLTAGDERSTTRWAGELTQWLLACSPPALTPGRRPAADPARSHTTKVTVGANGGDATSDPQAVAAASAGEGASANGAAHERAGEQRERILEAVLEVAAQKGCKAMSHRDIASAAKVSYSTFYNHFTNKEQALIAASELAQLRLCEPLQAAFAASSDWARGVSEAVLAYLRGAAENPREARLVGCETLRVGRAGLHAFERHASQLEALLRPGFDLYPDASPVAATAFAGATLELLRYGAEAGRTAELPAAAPVLSYVALAPFMGATDAQRVARFRPRFPTAGAAPARERAPAAHRA